mgnify:CR=1 FL=1
MNIEEGKQFGVIEVIERCEDYEGKSDTRKQYLCICNNCGNLFKTPARNLTRRPNRKGCINCLVSCNNKGVKYGRNINGFIDKRIIIKK